MIRAGEIVATGALEVGGRFLSWDRDGDRRLRHVSPVAGALAPAGARLAVGQRLTAAAERELAAAAADQILAVPCGRPDALAPSLVLTETAFDVMTGAEAITFAGGVAEYIYGREPGDHGDMGRAIGDRIRRAIGQGTLPAPVLDPGQGIRATVVGASQNSVQVSGSTVAVSDPGLLPLRNLSVRHPELRLPGEPDPADLAASLRRALRAQWDRDGAAVALAVRFEGPPSHRRLHALADAIGLALGDEALGTGPVVILLDRDLGASLGTVIAEQAAVRRPVICLDNLDLKPLDYVDIGSPFLPAGVFPVVIKSLLFGPAATDRRG
jgi:ethanolamine utilization protein EutA